VGSCSHQELQPEYGHTVWRKNIELYTHVTASYGLEQTIAFGSNKKLYWHPLGNNKETKGLVVCIYGW
jgi:hypothetical protein